MGGGWFLRVTSVDWNAASKIAALPGQHGRNTSPSAGDVTISIIAVYRGGGESDVRIDFADRVFAIGARGAPHGWDSPLNACGPGK